MIFISFLFLSSVHMVTTWTLFSGNCFTFRKPPLNDHISTPHFYQIYSIPICDIKLQQNSYVSPGNHSFVVVLELYLYLVWSTYEVTSMMFSLVPHSLLSFDLSHLFIFQIIILSNHCLFPLFLFLFCKNFCKNS